MGVYFDGFCVMIEGVEEIIIWFKGFWVGSLGSGGLLIICWDINVFYFNFVLFGDVLNYDGIFGYMGSFVFGLCLDGELVFLY